MGTVRYCRVLDGSLACPVLVSPEECAAGEINITVFIVGRTVLACAQIVTVDVNDIVVGEVGYNSCLTSEVNKDRTKTCGEVCSYDTGTSEGTDLGDRVNISENAEQTGEPPSVSYSKMASASDTPLWGIAA